MAETIGSLIDKISIMELKGYHMRAQLGRTDTEAAHRQNCERKLDVIRLQSDDLSRELDELILDLRDGRKKLKIYRQFKMYNDPKYRSKKT